MYPISCGMNIICAIKVPQNLESMREPKTALIEDNFASFLKTSSVNNAPYRGSISRVISIVAAPFINPEDCETPTLYCPGKNVAYKAANTPTV